MAATTSATRKGWPTRDVCFGKPGKPSGTNPGRAEFRGIRSPGTMGSLPNWNGLPGVTIGPNNTVASLTSSLHRKPKCVAFIIGRRTSSRFNTNGCDQYTFGLRRGQVQEIKRTSILLLSTLWWLSASNNDVNGERREISWLYRHSSSVKRQCFGLHSALLNLSVIVASPTMWRTRISSKEQVFTCLLVCE